MGEILYLEDFFICNTTELLVGSIQDLIKSFNFCKAFNCPPHSSLDVTPANVVDDFLDIESEINRIAQIESSKIKAKK